MAPRVRGLAPALLAYVAWGFFPVYFHALTGVPALEVLAHRVLWSVVLLALATPLLGRWATALHGLGPEKRWLMVTSAVLIAANWGTYIWAVQAERVLQASLGYFVNPLVSVLLGVLFLRERLRRRQVYAIGLAGIGVVALVVRLHALPWLPMTLALTFGLYGLVRKHAGVMIVRFGEHRILDEACVKRFGDDVEGSFSLALAYQVERTVDRGPIEVATGIVDLLVWRSSQADEDGLDDVFRIGLNIPSEAQFPVFDINIKLPPEVAQKAGSEQWYQEITLNKKAIKNEGRFRITAPVAGNGFESQISPVQMDKAGNNVLEVRFKYPGYKVFEISTMAQVPLIRKN